VVNVEESAETGVQHSKLRWWEIDTVYHSPKLLLKGVEVANLRRQYKQDDFRLEIFRSYGVDGVAVAGFVAG